MEIEYLGMEMNGVDIDSDSVYDFMAVTVTLDVLSPGLLDMYAFLALDKSPDHNKWLYGLAYVEMYELTDIGIQEITMFVDGRLPVDKGVRLPSNTNLFKTSYSADTLPCTTPVWD